MPFVVNTERYLAPIDPPNPDPEPIDPPDPDPEPLNPFRFICSLPGGRDKRFTRIHLHFNADGATAQTYDADGNEANEMIVYDGAGDVPPRPQCSRLAVVGGKVTSNVVIEVEGCDGLEFKQFNADQNKKENAAWTKPPTKPGTLLFKMERTSLGESTISLPVTTDYVPYTPTIPVEIGDLAFVSGANATWDDNEHIDSLTFWVEKPAEGIRCVRKNMKQTSDGATFTFSASANVFISPRDDYSFVTAHISAVPDTEGYYRCTVELAGAADSPKSINIPVHIDR